MKEGGEGVLAVQGGGGGFRIAQRVLEGGHHQSLIQQGDKAHARRAQCDGDAGGQQLTKDNPPRGGRIRGGDAPAAQEKYGQHRQRQQRSGGDAGDGSGGAQGRVRAPVQQHKAQAKSDDQLAGGLRHLADGGGGHVPQPLGVASDGRGQADEQHCRAQRPDGRSGQRVVEQAAEPLGKQAHDGAAQKADDSQQRQRRPENAALGVETALRRRTGYQTGQGQRQTRRGQHQQQTVNVIGGVEVGHALLVQQVAQRDLVEGAQHLGHRHGKGQHSGAADKVVPSLCHAVPPAYFCIFSWNRRNVSRSCRIFSGRAMYSVGNLG